MDDDFGGRFQYDGVLSIFRLEKPIDSPIVNAGMRVISLERLRDFWERHSDAEEALRAWYKTAKKAEWSSLDDVRKTYSAADGVELDGGRIVTVFNVKGNNYRLVADIVYEGQAVYVKKVMTHPEYSRNKWKGQI